MNDALTNLDPQPAPWIIPGIIRRDWRVLITGGGGSGKTTVINRVATAAASGSHPFNDTRITPATTLVVDFEHSVLGAQINYQNFGWILHRPDGLDLSDQRQLEDIEKRVETVKPDILWINPLWQVRPAGEDVFESDRMFQGFLDRLRTEHQFAMIIEDHNPPASWARWSDVALKTSMTADGIGLEILRGNRCSDVQWPKKVV